MHGLPVVTRDEFEDLDESTAASLLRIRYSALVDAGCELEAAVVLAVHPEVELSDAIALLKRGCPPRTALRILL